MGKVVWVVVQLLNLWTYAANNMLRWRARINFTARHILLVGMLLLTAVNVWMACVLNEPLTVVGYTAIVAHSMITTMCWQEWRTHYKYVSRAVVMKLQHGGGCECSDCFVAQVMAEVASR